MGPELTLRTEGWQQRLNALFAEHADTPFAWGRHDCVTFAATAIELLTGKIVWAPDWKTEDEAVRTIVSLRGLEAAVTAVLGLPSSNWRLARLGDICLIRTPSTGPRASGLVGGTSAGQEQLKPALVVCTGQTLAGPGPTGIAHTPLEAAEKVWRVG